MKLNSDEILHYVNDDLSLIQKPSGLTFGTDALLLAGFIHGKYGRGAEFGAGSGIISMLLLTRDKISHATAIEVQEEYADLCQRNAELNGLTEKLASVLSDVRDFPGNECFDIIYTNPPYMTVGSGKSCATDKKNVARHEVFGGIADFCVAARRLLKFGGTFAAVYRPDRLTDLICAMRDAGIEPKRMTFVHADTASEPSMVLIEGKRGGRCGMKLTSPLIIYKDKEHKQYTVDMEYIMENGSFPTHFLKR